MARYQVQSPDGQMHVFEGPDGATPDQVLTVAKQTFGEAGGAPKPGPIAGAVDWLKNEIASTPKDAGNLVAGAVRGAGSIGATLLAPYDMARDALDGKGLSLASNQQRRADMTGGLQSLGADPNSIQFKTGKIGAEIAGTAGVGGALANGFRALPFAGPVADAIATGLGSGGFSTGGALGPVANTLTRLGTGAASGGATAGLIDPKNIPAGAAIGGVAPFAVQGAGWLGGKASDLLESAGTRLMQSALKPTIKQLKSGDAAIAARTLLDNGINATKGGVEKLRGMVDSTDQQISNAIAGSNATVSKANVLDAMWPTRARFANQVDPMPDINAIDGVAERFYLHPNLTSGDAIPVQLAQDLKQGTYQALSKKYGLLGSADVEAQKGLARGLKEGIADAVPAVAGLNAQQSALLKTLDVTERRALMDANKNPMGLAALAHSPASWAMFMADKSALFKSLAARMVNSAAPAGGALGLLGQATPSPLLRSGLLSIEANP